MINPPTTSPPKTHQAKKTIKILGLDPGLRKMGWGLIECEGNSLHFKACGAVTSDDKLPLAERLKQLFQGLTEIIETLHPDEVAVEETFVNKDAKATLKLGHARAMALLVPALADLPVAEYAANLVKKSIVGSGHADKKQIQAMIKVLLPKSDAKTEDAADALAIAITHAHHRKAHEIAKTTSR